MTKKVYMASLGCPKNQVDAEVMIGTLVEGGYEITLDPDAADVLLVNTCAFIGPAKEESIGTILEMAELKERRAGRKLVVTGCLAQRYAGDLQREMPEIDAFVGTGDYLRLAGVLADLGLETGAGPPAYVGAQHVLPDATVPRILTGAFYSAYLKVSEGCDHRCAFCIIPKIRGRHESRPLDDVVAEARSLTGQGVREINLIAQDLTAWGRDLPEKRSLAMLLRALGEIDGLDWVRLLYCYPNSITVELLDAIAEVPNVCKYVDVPLQHAADPMLRAMRRGHTGASLRRLVDRIRTRVPGVVLRTSFIVGFPGETDADFAELCRFVEESQFDRVGVFRYSQEENTEAGAMPDQLPERVKRERWNHLMGLQRDVARRMNAARVGSVLPVLACGTDDRGRAFGRFEGQAPDIDGVVFLEGNLPEGQILAVEITGSTDYDLRGRPLPASRSTTASRFEKLPGVSRVGTRTKLPSDRVDFSSRAVSARG